MPWPPDEARAIAARYRRDRKPIPEHVKAELSRSLRGKRQPRRKKRRRRSSLHAKATVAHENMGRIVTGARSTGNAYSAR